MDVLSHNHQTPATMLHLSFLYTLVTMALVYFGLEFVSIPPEHIAFHENRKLLCTVLFIAPYLFLAMPPLLRTQKGFVRSALEILTACFMGWGALWATCTNTNLREFQLLSTYFEGVSLWTGISVLAGLWLAPLLVLSRIDYLIDVARRQYRTQVVPR